MARRDDGAGLFASITGVLVFLAFLLFAVQLLLNLYATSAVTNAAWDGARQVAGARSTPGDPVAQVEARTAAEQRVRAELGRFGEAVTFDWSGTDGETVSLRIRADAPRFLLGGLGGAVGFDHIDRSAHVRVERWR